MGVVSLPKSKCRFEGRPVSRPISAGANISSSSATKETSEIVNGSRDRRSTSGLIAIWGLSWVACGASLMVVLLNRE
jgi:hypothetical protein